MALKLCTNQCGNRFQDPTKQKNSNKRLTTSVAATAAGAASALLTQGRNISRWNKETENIVNDFCVVRKDFQGMLRRSKLGKGVSPLLPTADIESCRLCFPQTPHVLLLAA